MSVDDETRYKIFKLLQDDPCLSQRELSRALNVSLGKTNYCLKALMSKGLIKVKNFQNAANKKNYAYILTRKGIEDKAKVTMRFLKYKINEYESIQCEIKLLRKEVAEIKS